MSALPIPIPVGVVPAVVAVRQLLEAAGAARRCGDRGAAELLEVDALVVLRTGLQTSRREAQA